MDDHSLSDLRSDLISEFRDLGKEPDFPEAYRADLVRYDIDDLVEQKKWSDARNLINQSIKKYGAGIEPQLESYRLYVASQIKFGDDDKATLFLEDWMASAVELRSYFLSNPANYKAKDKVNIKIRGDYQTALDALFMGYLGLDAIQLLPESIKQECVYAPAQKFMDELLLSGIDLSKASPLEVWVRAKKNRDKLMRTGSPKFEQFARTQLLSVLSEVVSYESENGGITDQTLKRGMETEAKGQFRMKKLDLMVFSFFHALKSSNSSEIKEVVLTFALELKKIDARQEDLGGYLPYFQRLLFMTGEIRDVKMRDEVQIQICKMTEALFPKQTAHPEDRVSQKLQEMGEVYRKEDLPVLRRLDASDLLSRQRLVSGIASKLPKRRGIPTAGVPVIQSEQFAEMSKTLRYAQLVKLYDLLVGQADELDSIFSTLAQDLSKQKFESQNPKLEIGGLFLYDSGGKLAVQSYESEDRDARDHFVVPQDMEESMSDAAFSFHTHDETLRKSRTTTASPGDHLAIYKTKLDGVVIGVLPSENSYSVSISFSQGFAIQILSGRYTNAQNTSRDSVQRIGY
jgi:hypothetical protein